MKKQIKKNIKQRYFFSNKEINKVIFKSISQNLILKKKIRWKSQVNSLKNINLGINSLVRIKNRCILTGRSKSNYRFLKLSRIQLKELASKGYLPGICKHSW